MKKKAKVTLESLSAQMQKGFKSVNKRFDNLETRLERYATATAEDIATLSDRFDAQVENQKKLDDDVNNGFSEQKTKLNDFDTRLSGVEAVVFPDSPPMRI